MNIRTTILSALLLISNFNVFGMASSGKSTWSNLNFSFKLNAMRDSIEDKVTTVLQVAAQPKYIPLSIGGCFGAFCYSWKLRNGISDKQLVLANALAKYGWTEVHEHCKQATLWWNKAKHILAKDCMDIVKDDSSWTINYSAAQTSLDSILNHTDSRMMKDPEKFSINNQDLETSQNPVIVSMIEKLRSTNFFKDIKSIILSTNRTRSSRQQHSLINKTVNADYTVADFFDKKLIEDQIDQLNINEEISNIIDAAAQEKAKNLEHQNQFRAIGLDIIENTKIYQSYSGDQSIPLHEQVQHNIDTFDKKLARRDTKLRRLQYGSFILGTGLFTNWWFLHKNV